ncbi:hypothetical protein V8B97DRAFT_1922232 [Scleroderma yunnanense]
MSICQYFLRGTCKFGDKCKNEHPQEQQRPQFGNQSWTANSGSKTLLFTTETLTNDVTLSKEKPLWPLSSYGAAKHEKVLVGGLDESPEELRVKAVTAVKAGTINDYMKYEAEKIAVADQMYANARNNISQFHDQAIKLSHGISSDVFGSSSAFGGPVFGSSSNSSAAVTSSNPSTLGSAFGQPAFGQSAFSSVPASTGFGQGASAFGSTSTFGQPSQTQPAFAQPQTASVFGQTSAFGQPSQRTSAFGQPSTSAFGQASNPMTVFGQSPQPPSAFGQAPQTTSLFGQSSLIKPASGPFSSTTPNSGAFGNTSNGGFSAFASQPSGFSVTSASPTGASSASVFGQSSFVTAPPAQTAQTQSPFTSAMQSAFGPSSTPTSMLAVPSPMSAFPSGSPFAASPTTGGARKPPSNGPDFALAKSRVRPKHDGDRFSTLLPPNYSDILPGDVKVAFASDKFEWGRIPEWIPPKEVR